MSQWYPFRVDAYLPNKAYEDSEFALDKLTHTGLYGIDTTVETVEDFFDIDIDYYARISFSSVIEIVDALGGIDVDVEIDFCEQDEYRNKDEAHQICLSSGEDSISTASRHWPMPAIAKQPVMIRQEENGHSSVS